MTLNWSVALLMVEICWPPNDAPSAVSIWFTVMPSAAAVNGDIDGGRRKIEVAGYVQKSRRCGEGVLEPLGCGEQFGGVRILQRVLILGLADHAADGDHGTVLQVN